MAACLIAIVALPLSLLTALDRYFFIDWGNTLWMVGYTAEYLRLYHHPENAFQTATGLGMAHAVFYGVLFHRFSALVAILTGPDIAVRLVIAGIVTAAVLTAYSACRALGASRGLALLGSAGVAFSSYELTNLYNRSAIGEYVAVTLLFTAMGAWFWSLRETAPKKVWLCRAILCASLTLMAGTHVITEFLGGTAFFFAAGFTLIFERRRGQLVTLLLALGAYLAGASVSLSELAALGHSVGATKFGIYFYGDANDSPLARLAPFPYDVRSVYAGITGLVTPYVEATVDYALALFAFAVVLRRPAVLPAGFLLCGALLAGLSIWPWFWAVAPSFVRVIQFPYRLVGYVDVLFWCAFLSALLARPDDARQASRTAVPWVALTLAIIACSIKLTHGATAMHLPGPLEKTPSYSLLPERFYGLCDYTLPPAPESKTPEHAAPPPVSMRRLDDPEPQRYVAAADGIVVTRVLAFPWNQLVVDGVTVPVEARLTWPQFCMYGFRAAPGSVHTVTSWFALPPSVEAAIRIAEIALILELCALAGISAQIAWSARAGARDGADRRTERLEA